MPQIKQDLLICAIGSEERATELAHRFREAFPRIGIHSGGMMDALFTMSQYHFRAVIVATVSDVNATTGIMVRKIRECGYSPNDIFVYRADNTIRGPVQHIVDEYDLDNMDGLFAAARKTAERDPNCRWLTQEDIDRGNAMVERIRVGIAEWKRSLAPPPPPKPWYLRAIDRIKKHWPFQR